MKLSLFLSAFLFGVASAGKGTTSPDVDGAAERSVPCDDGDGGVEYIVFGCEWEANGSPSESSKSRRRKRNLRKNNKDDRAMRSYVEVPEDEAADLERKLIATVTPENINCLLNFRGKQYVFDDIGFPNGWQLFREEATSTALVAGVNVRGDVADYFKYVYNFGITLDDDLSTSAKIELEFKFNDGGEFAEFDDQDVGIACPSR